MDSVIVNGVKYFKSPTDTQKKIDIEDRFLNRVKKSRGCWKWLGSIDNYGYGVIKYKGKILKAHRLSYMLNTGSIDDFNVIHHKCNVKHCVNPKHLLQVSNKENLNFFQNTRKPNK
jgi:hypothetical protein